MVYAVGSIEVRFHPLVIELVVHPPHPDARKDNGRLSGQDRAGIRQGQASTGTGQSTKGRHQMKMRRTSGWLMATMIVLGAADRAVAQPVHIDFPGGTPGPPIYASIAVDSSHTPTTWR